ncbi:hypothetical protein HZH66_001050 [Vespula vulgaris]|uniref:Integrase catalytic domain-containing protein n=1 Tax=Vespula vulgaris TaxID=7454 RepID=A0A834KVQ8_VESVU|nr:hypothetical protein HZH66_001050 [Vespula vulgaris]
MPYEKLDALDDKLDSHKEEKFLSRTIDSLTNAIKKYTLSFKYLKNSWKKNTLYLIAIGTPRANRQVERFNPVLTPMLAKLSDMPEKWDRILRDVEFSLNNIYCRSTIDYVGHLACISSGR